MTRFAVDAPTALRLVLEGRAPGEEHQLVGPASLRSDVLTLLYRRHRARELTGGEVAPLLDRLAALRMRLLGDRVSRRVAWAIAVDLGLEDTRPAEPVAVALLQADVLVTEDDTLRRIADGRVDVVRWDALAAVLR